MTARVVFALTVALTALSATACPAIQCVFVQTVGLSFGTYDVFKHASTDTAGKIVYRCTGVQPGETVRIDLGTGDSSNFNPRAMPQGSSDLGYNLYFDAARTVLWGDGSGGTSSYGPLTPPNDVDVTIQVYGRVTGRQDVTAGHYADTISAVMSY